MPNNKKKSDFAEFHDYDIRLSTRTMYIGSQDHKLSGEESGINGRSSEVFLKNMDILNSIDNEPIRIILNNPGGDWYHGMAIFDAMVGSPSPITVEVYGMAMSMAAVIMQAASKRLMSPNSRFMMHYGYLGVDGHSKTVKKWADENEKLNLDMEQIFLKRIREKHPKFQLEKLRQMLNFDTILSAKETVELGLADGILGEK